MTAGKPAYRMTVVDALVEKKHLSGNPVAGDRHWIPGRCDRHVRAVFATVFALMMIVVYITSGTLFVTASLPEPVAYVPSWNPVFRAVEWMRLAYYPGYSDKWLDKTYLISYGAISLCAGLLLERLLRMKMKEG